MTWIIEIINVKKEIRQNLLIYVCHVGATTMAIKQLSKSGLVKPLPFGKQSQVYKV